MVDIALYQPEIPPNAATIIRTAACLGVAVHIVGPAGFDWSERSFRRAGMDYLEVAHVERHADFDRFRQAVAGRRLVLATTRSSVPYTDFAFRLSDVLLFGRESAGVPAALHALADARVTIPMRPDTRSLNLAVAAAMLTGEALRQVSARDPLHPRPKIGQ